jgi:hypothetical protein
MAATPLIPFDAASTPTPSKIADDHSLLKIDQELDLLLEQIEDEIEESGEASKEAMDRLELFCQAMNVKVDRIDRYLSVMEARAAHCRQEAARYAQRAKRAQNKIDRTKSMVLYYLESHDLKQVESDDFTLRRQKNSQDSVIVSNPDVIPPDLKRYELKGSRGYLDEGLPRSARGVSRSSRGSRQRCRANEPSDQTMLRERQNH